MRKVMFATTPNDCWEVSSHSSKGRGFVRFTKNGKRIAAHRLQWELVNGPIPAGLVLFHTCGNRACVNPAHLMLRKPGCDPKPISHTVDDNGCHICNSHSHKSNGYARFSRDGKKVRIHRAIWEEHNGQKVPTGMLVMHTCDTPHCINPEHLKLGTHADNMADMKAKGRAHNQHTSTKDSSAAMPGRVMRTKRDSRRISQSNKGSAKA